MPTIMIVHIRNRNANSLAVVDCSITAASALIFIPAMSDIMRTGIPFTVMVRASQNRYIQASIVNAAMAATAIRRSRFNRDSSAMVATRLSDDTALTQMDVGKLTIGIIELHFDWA